MSYHFNTKSQNEANFQYIISRWGNQSTDNYAGRHQHGTKPCFDAVRSGDTTRWGKHSSQHNAVKQQGPPELTVVLRINKSLHRDSHARLKYSVTLTESHELHGESTSLPQPWNTGKIDIKKYSRGV